MQDWRAEERVRKALSEVNGVQQHQIGKWLMQTQGDPRGYVLRVIPPSYAERNAGRDRGNLDTIGVPARDSGLRF